MCGIIGIFNLTGDVSVPEASLRAGMQAMALRGPDGEGLFIGQGIGLGHRRLAIIDPAGGRQPLLDQASGAVIIFNGELYNYRELRSRLIAWGHRFVTASDTEVLLRAYLHWGTGCLEHLSGMFAFAIFDPRHAQLFVARDRIGVKPLFYSHPAGVLMFASTIPALRSFSAVSPVMDLQAVSHYLTTIRTTFGRQSLLRDIQVLLPGEYLLAQRGRADLVIRKYWDYPMVPAADKEDPGLDQAAGRVSELMETAVREQLVSDVPLGGFLSGGIDSSILASLAHRLSDGHFDAYSVGYDREGYQEWDFVREAAAFVGMRCREIHLAERDYPETWAWLVRQKGLPLSTANEVPIYHLARALRQDFTVALSGEGADEIFGGYGKAYFSAYDYDRARHSIPTREEPLTPLDRAIRRLYRRPYLLCVPDHFFLLCSWLSFRQKHDLLAGEIWDTLNADQALFGYYENWFERLQGCTTFDAYMHVHARINLEGLLFRVDSSTMAASVEARVPFTDHRVAEYLFSLPDHYKMDWRSAEARAQGNAMNTEEIDRAGLVESKVLLRRAFRNRVPGTILNRPKMSFPVPFREWVGEWLYPTVERSIREAPLMKALFKQAPLERLLTTAWRPDSGMSLWPLANLGLWQLECGVTMP